jgi:hypothetical protein
VAVHDTREWVEDGDRWVAIPGSGHARSCDRCGRDHEIHVEVELAGGRTALIGQGCARGDSMEGAVRASVSAEQTRARLARQLEDARGRREAARRAWAIVERLPLPAATLSDERVESHGRTIRIYGMDDASVWCHGGFDDERRRALVSSWRRNRYAERGDIPRTRDGRPEMPDAFDGTIWDLERRLKKVQAKLPPPPSSASSVRRQG